MANVAGTKNTGPASKDAVSGGKTFPIKEKQVASPGQMNSLTNTSNEAHSRIMALRVSKVKNGNWGGYPGESTFTSPKKTYN